MDYQVVVVKENTVEDAANKLTEKVKQLVKNSWTPIGPAQVVNNPISTNGPIYMYHTMVIDKRISSMI